MCYKNKCGICFEGLVHPEMKMLSYLLTPMSFQAQTNFFLHGFSKECMLFSKQLKWKVIPVKHQNNKKVYWKSKNES